MKEAARERDLPTLLFSREPMNQSKYGRSEREEGTPLSRKIMNDYPFENARWIWPQEQFQKHEYADFVTGFFASGNQCGLYISAKTDYAVWLNGTLVGFNQYRDFPECKVYDEWDLSPYLVSGENRLAILSVAYNENFSSRIADGKGVIFSVREGNRELLASSIAVAARLDPCYQSGDERLVTSQLGYGFAYDATGEDAWRTRNVPGFAPAMEVPGGHTFFPRPIEKMHIEPPTHASPLSPTLFDLGREYAGYLSLEVVVPRETELTVAYGEHIVDGGVRRLIGKRDFSVRFRLRAGVNRFDEYFFRMGLRYLEFSFADPEGARVVWAGVRECLYPVTVLPFPLPPRDKRIYDVSVHTLRTCMHEHYEDCPWREQAQYAMDGRTAMTCTYLAFGETRFVRAALVSMGKRRTEKGFFPITSPNAGNLSILSFNFAFVVALDEYVQKTGDTSIVAEVAENTRAVLDMCLSRREGTLLPNQQCWNFVEWTHGLSDSPRPKDWYDTERISFIGNAWFVLALTSFADVLERTGEDGHMYREAAEGIVGALAAFRDPVTGYFFTFRARSDERYEHLAAYTQYIAVWAGVVKGKEAEALLEKTMDHGEELVALSLSSHMLKYEQLLRYPRFMGRVLDEMRVIYDRMLEAGATTFWETEKGEADFKGAGSLCHAWSVIPIYVYHKIMENGGQSTLSSPDQSMAFEHRNAFFA